MTIHTILFDAVGTLITPRPTVAEVYSRIGNEYGSRLSTEVVAGRFRTALSREVSSQPGFRTDETAERQFWRQVVEDVLEDLPENTRQSCFDELFRWFAQPQAWRVYDDVSPALDTLARQGWRLAIASNFDARLHTVCAGLPELDRIAIRFASSELGWRKPAAEFFHAACDRLGERPENILYVGDEPESDVAAAKRAGLPAVWICRDDGCSPADRGFPDLRQFVEEFDFGSKSSYS